MHRRCVPAIAAVAAALAVCLAACSTGAPRAGALHTPLTGTAEWGLTEPLAMVTGIEDLTSWSEDGITYVASIDPATGALDVHHLRWDGTEAWTATVSPPAEAAVEAYRPRMSYDSALGVVAYWFTLSAPDAERTTLDSPVHWFTSATGEGGELAPAPTVDGGRLHSHSGLIGAVEHASEPDGSVYAVAITYLREDLTPASLTVQEAFANRHREFYINQRAGLLLVNNKTTLIVSGAVTAQTLKDPWLMLVHGREVLLAEGETSTVSRISQGALEPLEAPACTLVRDEAIWSRDGTGGTVIGNLIVPTEGEAYCLDEALAGTDLVPATVLPSGQVLLVEVEPEAEATATPEATSTPEATEPASPEETDGTTPQEYSFSVYSPDTGTVTALGRRIWVVIRGGGAVVTDYHEDEGTTTITLYSADTLDLVWP